MKVHFFFHKKTLAIKNILGKNWKILFFFFFKCFDFLIFFYCSPVTDATLHLALQEGREQG